MDKGFINKLTSSFESCVKIINNVEFWFARDLQELLEYTEWRNFDSVLNKAKISCKTAGFNISDHFVEVNKTIDMPKGAKKDILDYMLIRYACYLIAQNYNF